MKGLTSEEAAKRRADHGDNVLAGKEGASPLRIFLRQFRDVMVLILLAAAVISALLGESADAVTIAVIVVLNAILGFVQEYRTEKTLLALRSMTAPAAQVWRDGRLQRLPASELVPDDCIELEAGDCVPADAVVHRCATLFAEESVLTGESEQVEKHAHTDADGKVDNSIGRADVLYHGTSVTRGNAEAVVIATGKETQMGQISQLLSGIDRTETPLQKRLGELGKVVAVICLAVCTMVSVAGILRGEPAFEMLMTGITIAIAAIPEGLPATVTIALALAVRRMLARNALINRLHAVETLGCASVICTDKTGTITENKMTVQIIQTAETQFTVSGSGWQKKGTVEQNGRGVSLRVQPDLIPLFRCAVLCNHAKLTDCKDEWEISGDPTEAALLVAAAKCRITADNLTRMQQIAEIPFESETRSMTVFVRGEQDITAYSKGAVDVILSHCGTYLSHGQAVPLNAKKRAEILCAADGLAEDALRTLAFAMKRTSPQSVQPDDMVFLGMMGMIDPPREQARQAVSACVHAGIRVVMLTGDHVKTASAIARRAGIPHAEYAMSGAELDRISDEELAQIIEKYAVFARVTPAHKLRLVRAFRAQGKIAAMTGDGVNDAPAVKEADIGVAMGKNGTDVTRQAADVILLDDRFDTLVAAVEQGRTVYANIRKFVRYLLACNIGEVLTMLFGILMGLPMVLLPTQILLVNLMTDGLPAIALGLEPTDPAIMHSPPRAAEDSFFSNGLLSRIVFRGIFIALSTLGSFTTVLRMSGSQEAARTAALVTLITSQLLHVFECKSEEGTLFSVPYFSNGKLIGAVFFSAVITAAGVFLPQLQAVFQTVSLDLRCFAVSLGCSMAVPVAAALTTQRGKEAVRPVRVRTVNR